MGPTQLGEATAVGQLQTHGPALLVNGVGQGVQAGLGAHPELVGEGATLGFDRAVRDRGQPDAVLRRCFLRVGGVFLRGTKNSPKIKKITKNNSR